MAPTTNTPKGYQETGIAFLKSRNRALLADDAGLGKSMQMIKAANALGLDRILIVAPAVARSSWALQLAEWDETCRPVAQYPKQEIPKRGPCVVIVGMEALSRLPFKHRALGAMRLAVSFDVAFIDEAHGLKSPSAKRTKAVYGDRLNFQGGLLTWARRYWLATATPTPLGHVGELYSHLRTLFPDVLADLFGGKTPNHDTFERHFCYVSDTNYGRVNRGNRDDRIGPLRDALRPHILMRRKADVLADLPPINAVALPLDTGFVDPKALTDAQLADMTDEEVEAALARALAKGATARKDLGQLKFEAATPWIIDFLQSDPTRKLLVFAHHRDVIDGLEARLKNFNPAVIHGGVTPAHKVDAVARFQSDPNCRVFIGQNIAAGTAITLTAASTVLLLEPHPSPDQNYQIISRAHRIGQTSSVTAMIAYDANDPLDRRQAQILRRRAAYNKTMFGTDTPGVIPEI